MQVSIFSNSLHLARSQIYLVEFPVGLVGGLVLYKTYATSPPSLLLSSLSHGISYYFARETKTYFHLSSTIPPSLISYISSKNFFVLASRSVPTCPYYLYHWKTAFSVDPALKPPFISASSLRQRALVPQVKHHGYKASQKSQVSYDIC